LPDGGTVTVLQSYDDPQNSRTVDLLTTFRSVVPGDALQAGRPKARTTFVGQTASMTAHMPTDAYSATLYFACGSSSQISGPPNGLETLTFYESCQPNGPFNMLALRDGNGQRDYMWQPGTQFVTDGDVTVNDTFAPMGQYMASLTNIPPQENINVTSMTMIDTFPVQLDAKTFDPTVNPTSQNVMLAYPPNAGNGTVLWEREGQGIYLRNIRVDVETSSPASVAWDLSELPLPSLGTSQASATGVTWNETGTGNASERVVLWVGQFGSHIANWTIVEPAAPATSSALVPLPADYAADDPTANPTSNFASTVWYVAYSNAPDYASAHPYGPALVDPTQVLLDVDHHAHVAVTH
ncbi:MAG: hypothetical protein JO257_32825, partial [Deltaproteobacteria bacterium]|nr:hypothetical protein [Deltaproteobacteria bacterium]